MMNYPARIVPPGQGSIQGLECPTGFQTFPYRPPQELSAVKVHDRRHEQPALCRRHVSDIGYPNLIGALRRRPLQQQVGSNRLVVLAVGRPDLTPLTRAALEPLLTHQPFHSLVVILLPSPTQFVGNARAAISAPLGRIDGLDLFDQLAVGHFPSRLLALQPAIVSASSHLHRPAQRTHRIRFGKLFNHAVFLLYCSERIAAVFFNMSRCMVTRASSLRNCRFSRASASALCGRAASAGLAVGPYRRFQSLRFHGLIPNSLATCAALLPLLTR